MNTYRIELFTPDQPATKLEVDALKPGRAITRALDSVDEYEVVAVNCRLDQICVPLQPMHLRVRPVAP